MTCPKCNSADFAAGRQCGRCGYQEQSAAHIEFAGAGNRRRRVGKSSGNLFFEFAREQPAVSPASDWRQELKKKLAEVQEKKAHPERALLPGQQQASLPAAPPLPAKPPEIRRTPVDPQPVVRGAPDIHRNLREFHASIGNPVHERRSGASLPSRQPPVRKEFSRGPTVPTRATAELVKEEPDSQSWIVEKSILLTRTLSGLIDLLIVAACSALFLGVSTRLGGIDVMSRAFRPAVWGSVLFFQISYSLYFLGMTQRTVGMMITRLKVVPEEGEVRFRQMLLRSLLFFLSCLPVMLGLLWGLWDRRSRCLHDSLSHTIVIRC